MQYASGFRLDLRPFGEREPRRKIHFVPRAEQRNIPLFTRNLFIDQHILELFGSRRAERPEPVAVSPCADNQIIGQRVFVQIRFVRAGRFAVFGNAFGMNRSGGRFCRTTPHKRRIERG